MEKKKIINTIELEDGEYLEKKFSNCLEMARHAVDWTLFCHYKLRPNCVDGIYKILKLTNMQLAYTKEVGGVMYEFATPKESICLSIIINVEDKACLTEMKVKTGMIAITQSERIYNFITNKGVEIIDISCNKDDNFSLYNTLRPYANKFFYDKDKYLQTLILELLHTHTNGTVLDTTLINSIEKKITNAIFSSITDQEVNIPTFKSSEQIALKIREQLFHHMDTTISIENLTQLYNISDKSLQTAFKSIFGFTPVLFIRLMKLNLVYHELLKTDSPQVTVTRVAKKWGFKHMGRFSLYYKELFLEFPSETLQKQDPLSNELSSYCVQRQEEI